MKKNEYLTPEMAVVEIKNDIVLLAGSGEEPVWPENPPVSED